jgi:diguanylate cyclase (GGDEF)-like protein/PAS domain S-box-containing protein
MTNGERPPPTPGARSRPRRLSLAHKFIALSGSLVLLTSTSIALFVVRKAGDEGRRTLLRHGLQTAELLAQNAEYAVYTEDPGALEALTSVTAIDGDVAYVVITNAAGKTLAHKERGHVSPPAARAERHQDLILHEERVDTADRQRYIDIVAPVKSGGASLGRVPAVAGHVRLGLSFAGLERSARAFMEVVAGLTSILILLGVAIVYLMARRTVAPIEKLRQAAHAIGAGHLDVQIEETGTAEIVDLARAFEVMLRRLRESRVELETQAADLRESQERYALAARAANDGLWDWNIETGEAYFSPRWRAMLGLPESERVAGIEEWFRLVHSEDRASLRMQVDGHLKGDSVQVSATYRVSHPGGERWMLCRGLAVRDAAGRAVRLAGSQTDITAQKLAEDQLIHDALHDSLTGLPNRALFLDRLQHALRRAGQLAGRRREQQFAVLFVDLDRFKVINDSLGHLMGDRLLVDVARRIAGCLRPGDTAARLGGDEFAVLLEDIDEEVEARKVAERIVQRVAEPVVLEGRTIYTGASVGVTLAGGHGRTPEEVLRDSDIAMYHAKRQGGIVEVFDPSMSSEALGRMGLENDLRGALDTGQLVVHYQPVLFLRTRRLVGFEALLRWRHPQRGLVPPSEFISILEETGLIVGVGRYVLREACLRLREWIDRNPGRKDLRTSVNVSAAQFTHTSVASDVRAALQETGLRAANLAIEITESAFLSNPTTVARELAEIRSLGVGIYLDDFGTGYSSLAYLTRFPIDYLKIDGSFVGRMNQHRAEREVVRAIAAIAHNLGMGLIAEGVEDGDQLSTLRELSCELGQGWLFSPAVEPDHAERLINTWSGDDVPAEVASGTSE